LSTSYHPQTDGQSERLNQCVETYLRCMVFEEPRKWVKWLPLAEWWYNTNFHTSIKLTPFEALYGYSPPLLPMGSVPRSCNLAVNSVLNDRQEALRILKGNLVKAQAHMKKYADMKRVERKFSIGDWVYLKLQPYRQVTVQGAGKNHKLKPRFYGPFEILAKMGAVAYQLNLPVGSLIHPVFHVSQLKKKIGPTTTVHAQLPLMGPGSQPMDDPEAILQRRMVKRNNQPAVQVLVKWANRAEEDATWEYYTELGAQFPNFCLEDKTTFEEGVLLAIDAGTWLGAVGERFELVNGRESNTNGLCGANGKTGFTPYGVDKAYWEN
jgi:Chromo (CHRromatin Organisation MOdifier) domain